jgi:large repetitive protein
VRALATAGLTDSNGSSVIYATTAGLGPIDGVSSTPAGGRVWVTTSASDGVPAFVDTTSNGPQGSINPSQFPVSSVATDSSDHTGNTAYVTIMGFTGGTGHVWKTTNAGASWTDFTGNLPDSPVNAVVVYPPLSQVYVGTDVGVFGSSTSAPGWTELGPPPSSGAPGFLPNVAVTALGVFASGGQQLLRASTYGRGIWQFNLVITPDFQLTIANTPQTVFSGQTATFNGAATALNGYSNAIALSCAAGSTSPPASCSPSPSTLTPANKTAFSVSAGGAAGDYNFNVKASGSDSNHLVHSVPVTLHLVNFGLTTPSPASVTVGEGTTSSPVSFQITAAGSFNQSVTVSCSSGIANATCTLTPGATVGPTSSAPVNMTAAVAVPAGTSAGSYPVTIQAATAGAPSALTSTFTLVVTSNPDFILTEPSVFPELNAGGGGASSPLSIASQDGFSGTVALTCPATYGAGSCSISPSSVSSYPATATLTINGASFMAGTYSLLVTGTSGSVMHTLAVPFSVGDYSLTGTQSVSGLPGGQATANFKLTSNYSYTGKINATCDASALAGAMCVLSPANPIIVASGGTSTLTATINIPNNAVPGTFGIKINTEDTTGVPSHSASVFLTLAQDFLVTSSTPSQTVTAGQTTGPYNLTVMPVGSSFTGAVTLACTTGLPAQAQCIFIPSTPVTPGNSAVDVVMSISTAASKARKVAGWPSGSSSRFYATFYVPSLLLPGLLLACRKRSRSWLRRPWRRKLRRALITAVLLSFLVVLLSCAGVSSGGNSVPPVNPVTYQVTVTGTSQGTSPDAGQSVVVTLVVD